MKQVLIAIGLLVVFAHCAPAQPPAPPFDRTPIYEPNASLFQRPIRRGSPGGLTLDQVGYTYIPTPPPKQIRKHDIVTIRVDHTSRLLSEGSSERRKLGQFNAVLNEWIRLVGLKALKPAAQADGPPAVDIQSQQIGRAESDLETRELVQFNIAATIVDIYPNGNVVLEAHRVIENNEEAWQYSLSGLCRKEDINPNTNTVLSRDIAQLRIRKREFGEVRDGYRRSWFHKIWDHLSPF